MFVRPLVACFFYLQRYDFLKLLCALVCYYKKNSTLLLFVIHAESIYCDISPPQKKPKQKNMYSSKNILRLEVREVPFLFYRFLGVNNVISM